MCTNIGATLGLGKASVLIGGVSDDPYDIRTKLIVRRPKKGYAYIGTYLAPLPGTASAAEYADSVSGAPTRGLNEQGLAFTWTLALEKPENQAPAGALKPHDCWDAVMRRAATVDDALALLQELPRGFSGAGMLADRGGALALAEIGRKRVNVTEKLSGKAFGSAVNVNCWIGMQAAEGNPICALENRDVPNHSRYYRAKEMLAQSGKAMDLATLAAMLSDHAHKERFAGENPWLPGHGYSICNHGSLRGQTLDAKKPAWGSVSAEIIDPVSGVFWYTYGWPCGEPPEYGDQLLQERSWGEFIGFPLAGLPEGDYTTLTGELTHLAMQHFDSLRGMPKNAQAGRVKAAA
ncbi:MAG: carcinine hydrolase/isopenicillin-N N-acyltransferase family protein [Gammaproteobacteria bacterium]